MRSGVELYKISGVRPYSRLAYMKNRINEESKAGGQIENYVPTSRGAENIIAVDMGEGAEKCLPDTFSVHLIHACMV